MAPPPDHPPAVEARARATLIGFGAVLLWSLLATLVTLTRIVPPFQLAAMAFAVGGLIGVLHLALFGRGLRDIRAVPPLAWALGVGGLFGYHLLYFLALRHAPALEANLLNYTWPLLIVLLAAAIPAGNGGGGLRWWHLAGAAMGLAGTALILTASTEPAFRSLAWRGYLLAAGASVTWSCYSVLSRRFTDVPSTAVAGYCLVTAVAAAICHLALEITFWPDDLAGWAAVLALGLGPVGAAFYLWDYGVKHGDLRVLGAAAYMAPLLSTLFLVALGLGHATHELWIACLLITGGAALAAREMLFRGGKAAGQG